MRSSVLLLYLLLLRRTDGCYRPHQLMEGANSFSASSSARFLCKLHRDLDVATVKRTFFCSQAAVTPEMSRRGGGDVSELGVREVRRTNTTIFCNTQMAQQDQESVREHTCLPSSNIKLK